MNLHQNKKRISWPFHLRRSNHAKQLELHWFLTEQRILKSRSVLEWQKENRTVISKLSMITLELAITRGGHTSLITTWDGATDRGRICLTIETKYTDHRKVTHLVMSEPVVTSSRFLGLLAGATGKGQNIVVDPNCPKGKMFLLNPNLIEHPEAYKLAQ